MEAYGIATSGRDLLLAEVDRLRRRVRLPPNDASDRDHDWREATGDTRDISVLASLVRDLAASLAA